MPPDQRPAKPGEGHTRALTAEEFAAVNANKTKSEESKAASEVKPLESVPLVVPSLVPSTADLALSNLPSVAEAAAALIAPAAVPKPPEIDDLGQITPTLPLQQQQLLPDRANAIQHQLNFAAASDAVEGASRQIDPVLVPHPQQEQQQQEQQQQQESVVLQRHEPQP